MAKTETVAPENRLPQKIPGSSTGMFIIASVNALGKKAYGAEIARHLNRHGWKTEVPRVYQTLSRLEDAGLLSSHVPSGGDTLRGKPVRVYTLTSQGQAIINFFQKPEA